MPNMSLLKETREKKKIETTNDSEDSPSSQKCFSCKLKDTELIQCSSRSCNKYYHKKCLEGLPYSKKEVNLCPLHICSTCFYANPKNPQAFKGDMLKCDKCPVAFHDNENCTVPGTVVTENCNKPGTVVSTCPKHFSPEKHREYCAITSLSFCVECSCNLDLISCVSCPTAIHEDCLQRKVSSDNFTCDRCLTKKTVPFGTVVWAKCYEYRWWPALIVSPEYIPDHVMEEEHFDGEFVVKFFVIGEYHWLQSGRVYPFFYRKLNMEKEHLHHDFKKMMSGDTQWDDAVKLALAVISLQSTGSADPKKPPPYKHIKSNRPVGDVQIYTNLDSSELSPCGCNPGDQDPCGYDSMCLNRGTCTECHADTCSAGIKCQNQKFQKLEYPMAKPIWTETRGWGLKSLEDIKKGTFVNEYCGDLIDEEEYERRVQEKQRTGDTNFYFCTLDGNRIIDAGPKGNFSRFMNHSCEPNCEMQKWMVLGDVRVGLFAKTDIEAGSELTFDYQMDFHHYDKLKCECGTERCAGLIGKKLNSGSFHASTQSDGEDEETEKSPTVLNGSGSVKKPNKVANGSAKKQKKATKEDDVKEKKRNKAANDNGDAKKRKKTTKDDDAKEKQKMVAKDNGVPKKQKKATKDDDVNGKKRKRVAKNNR